MKKNRLILVLSLISAVTLLISGCKDKEALSYDRAALLNNIGDRIILPAYQNLSQEFSAFETTALQFRADKSLPKLNLLQEAMRNTWKSWKQCTAFEFGPAATKSLRASINTFPADTGQIKSNIAAGNWDLNLANNLDAKGFQAFDFLLFGLGTDDNAILSRYLNPQDSTSLQNYLFALLGDAKGLVAQVNSEWQNGYLASFKSSIGTDVGSSTSLLVNELNRDLEIIKTASIGIPIGKQTFGTALPEKCEALYSGLSLELILAEIEGLERIFKGEGPNENNAYGLSEALDEMEALYQGENLSAAINAQFQEVKNAIQAIPSALSIAVLQNPASVENAYTQIQKLVILLKTDMASSLSILITYTDADGD